MFGFQFYPTPEKLADRMAAKINWERNLTFILEPSAGKGDLIEAVRRVKRNNRWGKDKPIQVECCEIDNNLRSILADKHCILVGTDFLEYNTYSRYDLIIMNPPFADGEKHLLKAIGMMKNGGQIVAIINAETIKNPYTIQREILCDTLLELNADIEYLQDEFVDAERKTSVEVALIYIDIPTGGNINDEEFKGMILGKDYEEKKRAAESEYTELATDDFIGNVIKQFDFEARTGLKLLDIYDEYSRFVPKNENFGSSPRLINIVSACIDGAEVDFNPHQKYIRNLRHKYWNLLFNSREMGKLMTEGARTKLMHKLREFANYDFNLTNIKQLQINLVNSLNQNIDEAILKQFDNFTYQYSREKTNNVHYFNSWNTNNAYRVREKVIVPCYSYSRWSDYNINNRKVLEYLTELEKIFVYLDGGKTEGDDVETVLRNAPKPYNGERVQFKYFDAEFKKKETLHIWFTNADLLKKFNIFGANKHGWLPNDYGKKKYDKMSKEEQDIIDGFEGKQSYDAVCSDADKYLSSNNLLMLGIQKGNN